MAIEGVESSSSRSWVMLDSVFSSTVCARLELDSPSSVKLQDRLGWKLEIFLSHLSDRPTLRTEAHKIG